MTKTLQKVLLYVKFLAFRCDHMLVGYESQTIKIELISSCVAGRHSSEVRLWLRRDHATRISFYYGTTDN